MECGANPIHSLFRKPRREEVSVQVVGFLGIGIFLDHVETVVRCRAEIGEGGEVSLTGDPVIQFDPVLGIFVQAIEISHDVGPSRLGVPGGLNIAGPGIDPEPVRDQLEVGARPIGVIAGATINYLANPVVG